MITPISLLWYIPTLLIVIFFALFMILRLISLVYDPCLRHGHNWELMDQKKIPRTTQYESGREVQHGFMLYVFKCKNCHKLKEERVHF